MFPQHGGFVSGVCVRWAMYNFFPQKAASQSQLLIRFSAPVFEKPNESTKCGLTLRLFRRPRWSVSTWGSPLEVSDSGHTWPSTKYEIETDQARGLLGLAGFERGIYLCLLDLPEFGIP